MTSYLIGLLPVFFRPSDKFHSKEYMVDENRRGKEFSSRAKNRKKEEVNFCCEGCGRQLTSRRTNANPSVEALEIHHDPPISQGGGKRSRARVFCGPNRCHSLVDRLAMYGVSFSNVEEKLGSHPLAPYVEHFDQGRRRRAEGRVLRRLWRAG